MSDAASSAARDAVLLAQAALICNDIGKAADYFGRALRLAPGDPTATLGMAIVRLQQRSLDAIALFADVGSKHDVREAWTGLATACRLAGQTERAAEAAARALGHHAYPTAHLANDFSSIASEIGAPGWCALDSQRRLIVHLHRRPGLKATLTVSRGNQRLRVGLPKGSRPSLTKLPDEWSLSGKVEVRLGTTALLGSPIDLDAIMLIEGFVDTNGGDLHGWAWHPCDVERDPELSVATLDGSEIITVTADDRETNVGHPHPLARPRAFRIEPVRLLQFDSLLRVMGHKRIDLTGSPVDPSAEQRSAVMAASFTALLFPSCSVSAPQVANLTMAATPARTTGRPPKSGSMRRSVDVVVPVYGGLDLSLACLRSVIDVMPAWGRLVVVDDHGPEPALSAELASMAKAGLLTLMTRASNGGFPMAANAGMRHDLDRDIVLLNSDTLVPAGWLERLRNAAYSEPAIGSATPISNDATILSYPSMDDINPVPTMDDVVALDQVSQRACPGVTVDIPTSIGFCVYIKRDCLDDTGLFREDVFAQGYCEENDLSMRARHLGWRHVAVPGIFVGHVGAQSFRATRRYLIERNMRLLNRLHPGYDALIRDHKQANPLAGARRNLDAERWLGFRTPAHSVLLITHGRAGGVQTHIAARAETLRRTGIRPIVMWPAEARDGVGRDCLVGDGPEGGTPNLRYTIPGELEELAELLRGDHLQRAEVHHLVGHDHAVLELLALLNIPYDMVVHDYASFCPRITLTRENRYCGEPALQVCEYCIADNGRNDDDDIRPTDLVARSAREFAAATRVVVPSEDVARRLRRHFSDIVTTVQPWQDDSPLSTGAAVQRWTGSTIPRIGRSIDRIVCVAGAIGIEKGYEYLLACVRDARNRRLALRFVVVGFTVDDSRLLGAGPVSITGRYDEVEAIDLIRSQRADVAFLPSLWPETWSYALTEMWHAGLDVVAFDIGAPAERIRQTGRGGLVPLGLAPKQMNDLLSDPHWMRGMVTAS